MIFQDPTNPPAAGQPSGGESQVLMPASQSSARVAWAFEYMDEEIEEAMIASESPVAMPQTAIGPPGLAGRD